MTETPKQAADRLAASKILTGFVLQALHEYTDRDGKPLHWRIRLKHPETGEKWIRPMRLNGHGYELGEPKFESGKPLYALHTVASNPNAEVWIAEGEQKADALNKLGLVATTSGAADSAGKTDWRPLAGRHVTIWPDNDEAGRRYADAVTDALRTLDCTVRLIDVAALNLPPKGDAVDWLAANRDSTAADISALASIDSEGWPKPQPLAVKVTPEPYPLDALPDKIRAAVQEVQDFVKAPIPMVASSALAALSLASQAHADVRRAEKLIGPVGLFLLTIADSGERKSTCDGFFMSAIRDYEKTQGEAAKPKLKDHHAANEAWDAKRAGVKDKIRQQAKVNKPTTELESALRDLEHDKPVAPRIPRLLYVDATPEALPMLVDSRFR